MGVLGAIIMAGVVYLVSQYWGYYGADSVFGAYHNSVMVGLFFGWRAFIGLAVMLAWLGLVRLGRKIIDGKSPGDESLYLAVLSQLAVMAWFWCDALGLARGEVVGFFNWPGGYVFLALHVLFVVRLKPFLQGVHYVVATYSSMHPPVTKSDIVRLDREVEAVPTTVAAHTKREQVEKMKAKLAAQERAAKADTRVADGMLELERARRELADHKAYLESIKKRGGGT